MWQREMSFPSACWTTSTGDCLSGTRAPKEMLARILMAMIERDLNVDEATVEGLKMQ
jgi:hypothetical protein